MSSRFVFSASSTSGRELWVTDGTTEGTQLLADINPSGGSNPGSFYFQTEEGSIVSNPADLAALSDGRALFDADDGIHGAEPWITDGTIEGTHLVADINPGASSSTSQFGFVALGDGRALFAAIDGAHGYEPWVTDGTPEGTYLLADINPGAAGLGVFNFFATGDGRALFSINDGIHGFELWVTDGTAEGTQLLADINPGPSSSFPDKFTPPSATDKHCSWLMTVFMAVSSG
jgi:ELWxxDGT repeat protein